MTENFTFSSSVKDDVWHTNDEPNSYEWWYFDALSDDGRDALTIIFLDNFVFSPRYNRHCGNNHSENSSTRFPAIVFVFYQDGKPIYRALNEFSAQEFNSKTDIPYCKIGESQFEFEQTPYGTRYILTINTILRGGKKLRASLEWLLVESDFRTNDWTQTNESHSWNLVSPRSDVTGKIEVFDKKEKLIDIRQFRGTGYHDHNRDSRWLPRTVAEWQWGRAHFADATAVFYRYREIGQPDATTKLFLVKNNELNVHDARYEVQQTRRDYFGLKYPRRFRLIANDGFRLSVRQNRIIDSSFFYLRFLSEITLKLGDGKPRKTLAMTEHLAPNSLKFRWLDWLVNMRIGRSGKGAFLK